MPPSSKRVKTPAIVESCPATPTRSRRKNDKTVSTNTENVLKSDHHRSSENVVTRTPGQLAANNYDVFSLFGESKSSKKSGSSKKVKKCTSSEADISCVALDDILTDENEVVTAGNPNKSFIEGVFDKWMEKDPYATIDKYIPGIVPVSPDRPLTLFSPLKKVDRPNDSYSVPQSVKRPLYSPKNKDDDLDSNFSNDWGATSVDAARNEMLGGTPLFCKPLDPSAYSPCTSNNPSKLARSNWSYELESPYSPVPSNSTPHGSNLKTPVASSCRLRSALSGVKSLLKDKFCSVESPCGGTPVHFNLHGSSNVATSTPDPVKSTVLFGTVCYVDVRFNKDDRSEYVRREVASHGAKVEKNFTKKVTHVIFKEGKISTYMKAKELNIPVVSLLWIEACKMVGGLADPSLYPPTDDEKFQKEVPLEEARRRDRFLRRGQAFLDRLNGLLPPKPPRSRSKRKGEPPATEGKRKTKTTKSASKKSVKTTQPSKGPKKLDFNNPGSSGCNNKKRSDSDSDYESESDPEKPAQKDQKRRKSAPADLKEAGQRKLTSFFVETSKRPEPKNAGSEDAEPLLKTPTKSSNQGDVLKILTGGFVTADKKRRKLFDPNTSMSFSQPIPGTPVETSPYIKLDSHGSGNPVGGTAAAAATAASISLASNFEGGGTGPAATAKNSPPSKSTRSRTTSSKRSKKPRQPAERSLAARKSLAPLMECEEQSLTPTKKPGRNSLSCFELDKKTKVAVKSTPRIAFTSIPKDTVNNYKEIIKKLGTFEVDSSVTKRTTHLLTSAPARRTVNLLKAIARGCWVLDVDWLVYSDSNGKWMSEEPYEMKSFSEAVTMCRLEKQAFGKDFALDLFSKCGHIFVDSNVQPSRADLVELLKLCSGKVVHVSTSADVIVSQRPAVESSPCVAIVSPVWILDSITHNKSLPLDSYKI